MFDEITAKCPLFAGIQREQIDLLLNCLTAIQGGYKKDEFVFRAEEPALHVGIVLSGGVNEFTLLLRPQPLKL